MKNQPLYPFGFGLSYPTFDYFNFVMEDDIDGTHASLRVDDPGDCSGGEAVQIYLKRHDAPSPVPNYQLCGFIRRIELVPGQTTQVNIKIPLACLELVDEDGISLSKPGRFTFYVGGKQPDARSEELTENKVLNREYHLL